MLGLFLIRAAQERERERERMQFWENLRRVKKKVAESHNDLKSASWLSGDSKQGIFYVREGRGIKKAEKSKKEEV